MGYASEVMWAVKNTTTRHMAIAEKLEIAALEGEKVSASLPPMILPKNIPSPIRIIIRGTCFAGILETSVTKGAIYEIHANNPPVPMAIIATISQASQRRKYRI